MTAWSAGYISDIDYTSEFYTELSPAYLRFTCLLQGVRPPPIDSGSTYCELGCGQGVGTAIVAAVNPQMKFWGIDFNPAQISNARRLACDAGLENITYLDYSFEQAVKLPDGVLPQFDFITLHGVYSWVSMENRDFVVQFLDRYLKPGGVVLATYNCMPGWTVQAPMERLFREYARQHPGRSDVQAKGALGLSNRMLQANAAYFAVNPALAPKIAELASVDTHYLSHEYLNEHWSPAYHADVARHFEQARLRFVGSANLVENNDRLSIPPKMMSILEETSDPVWRETLRDFARNQSFRRDIFVRGASFMKPIEQSEELGKIRLCLLMDRANASFVFKTPVGEVKGSEAIFVPVLDALAERPRSVSELVAAVPGGRSVAASIAEAVSVLVTYKQIHPVPGVKGDAGTKSGRMLNKAIAARLRHGEILDYVAAPAAGTGVQVTYVDLLAQLLISEGVPPDATKAAELAWEVMARTGQRMMKGGARLEGRDDNIAELRSYFGQIFASKLPAWRTLGVV